MKSIVFITEVKEFINGLEARKVRRAFETFITRHCQKNASRSQQLLVLNICIAELKSQGRKVPCVPSLDGSTSESSTSDLVFISGDATSETGSSELPSTPSLPVACDAN